MNLNSFESQMLRDAVVEYWHNHIKHSQNEKIKHQYQCLMVDIKTITASTQKHTITVNN